MGVAGAVLPVLSLPQPPASQGSLLRAARDSAAFPAQVGRRSGGEMISL